ncbi:uncharacterized protein RHOBADRAFT_55995 [Rhodotorula graminis WP1]|uniref:Uncharacterized protein n=1 Tax=Rhodotorula graminis (strain WP1) TaxID=578459 RepID=A0A0P9EKF8_RHOGW|nr:uncharacterized protein RHOBADRAFT_55995 [Rhodotorula graminis WP1]KPV72162.1 hypothetical protein RHOBADRAFT_55995 [Rhodotorula graminis WP1]
MDDSLRSSKEVLHSQLVAFKRTTHWDALLPHERAKVVDLVLSSYVQLWTRRPEDHFDWNSIKYRELLKMVGVMAGTVSERNRIRHEQARRTYDAILASVERVEFACWRRPDALASFAVWRDELCSGAGFTIVKLQRIEHIAPGVVLRVLNAAVDQVETGLQAGRLPATFLPSGDELFVIAHTSTQKDSKRYADFLLFLYDLDKLYRTPIGAYYVPDGVYLSQLDTALETLHHPAQQAHFARLSPGQQLEALDKGRGILFSACAELRRAGRLPDPAVRIGRFYEAIFWPPVDEQGVVAGPSHHLNFASPSDAAGLGAPHEPTQQPSLLPSYFPHQAAAPSSYWPPAPQYHHHHHLLTSPSHSTPASYGYSPSSSASASSSAYFSPTMPQGRSPGMPPPWLAAQGVGPHGPAQLQMQPQPPARTGRPGPSRAASGPAYDGEERARLEDWARRRR